MSRFYSVNWSGDIAAADGDVDLLELLPADDKPCKLVGFILSQSSEIKEAEEETIRITVIRLPATVTSGSGGATVTNGKVDSADTGIGATTEGRNTTVATTSGTAENLDEMGWNLRGTPLERWWPDPMMRHKVKQGEGLFVRWQTTVADTVTVQFTAVIEEE